MADKKKKPDTLKQKRTRYYLRMILGGYLIYLAYNMFSDLRSGVEADQPLLVIAAIVAFAVGGAIVLILSFRGAMKIGAMEIKEKEAQEDQEEQEAQEIQEEQQGGQTEGQETASQQDGEETS